MGWLIGLEPTAFWATRRKASLSYSHHFHGICLYISAEMRKVKQKPIENQIFLTVFCSRSPKRSSAALDSGKFNRVSPLDRNGYFHNIHSYRQWFHDAISG